MRLKGHKQYYFIYFYPNLYLSLIIFDFFGTKENEYSKQIRRVVDQKLTTFSYLFSLSLFIYP